MDIRHKIGMCFRNNWGLKVNLQYLYYLQYCRWFSKKLMLSNQDKAMAKAAHHEGLAYIGKAQVQTLSEKVTEYFETIPTHCGLAQLPRSLVQSLAEPLYLAMKDIQKPVWAYYRSYFKINWIDIQKIVPGEQPKGSSFSYHIDDSPYSLSKIFIYLTDTYKDNGAFRAFNYVWTDKFLKMGMLKTTQPGEMREACQYLVTQQDEEALNVLEGMMGSAFIFDNNLVHKGTLPVSGTRVHISMEIMPSSKDFTLEDIIAVCAREPQEYYNPKPFSKLTKAGLHV